MNLLSASLRLLDIIVIGVSLFVIINIILVLWLYVDDIKEYKQEKKELHPNKQDNEKYEPVINATTIICISVIFVIIAINVLYFVILR